MDKKIVRISIVIILIFVVSISIYAWNRTIMIKGLSTIIFTIKEEGINVSIDSEKDLQTLFVLFSKTPRRGSPSCPFGFAELIFENRTRSLTLYPATDDCYIFKKKGTGQYVEFSLEEWDELMYILSKYGVDRELLESGRGI